MPRIDPNRARRARTPEDLAARDAEALARRRVLTYPPRTASNGSPDWIAIRYQHDQPVGRGRDRRAAIADLDAQLGETFDAMGSQLLDAKPSGNLVRAMEDLPDDMQQLIFDFCAEQGVDPPTHMPLRWAPIEDFPIPRIGTDPDDDRDQDYVDQMAMSLYQWPPVLVTDGQLIDGRHRLAAWRQAGKGRVPYLDLTGIIHVPAHHHLGRVHISEAGGGPSTSSPVSQVYYGPGVDWFQIDSADGGAGLYDEIARVAKMLVQRLTATGSLQPTSQLTIISLEDAAADPKQWLDGLGPTEASWVIEDALDELDWFDTIPGVTEPAEELIMRMQATGLHEHQTDMFGPGTPVECMSLADARARLARATVALRRAHHDLGAGLSVPEHRAVQAEYDAAQHEFGVAVARATAAPKSEDATGSYYIMRGDQTAGHADSLPLAIATAGADHCGDDCTIVRVQGEVPDRVWEYDNDRQEWAPREFALGEDADPDPSYATGDTLPAGMAYQNNPGFTNIDESQP